MSQIEKAKVFAELHVKGRPIILYNAWMRAALRPSRTPARRRPACSIRSFGNDEIRSEGLDLRYRQKYRQNGWLPRTFACIFNAPRRTFRKSRNRTSHLSD